MIYDAMCGGYLDKREDEEVVKISGKGTFGVYTEML